MIDLTDKPISPIVTNINPNNGTALGTGPPLIQSLIRIA